MVLGSLHISVPWKRTWPEGGLEQSVEVLDQGGLARPGVSDDPQVFALIGGKVHIQQGPALKGVLTE